MSSSWSGRASTTRRSSRSCRTYQGKVFRMALVILRDSGRAEEVTQDIFLKLWRALPAYDGRAAVSHLAVRHRPEHLPVRGPRGGLPSHQRAGRRHGAGRLERHAAEAERRSVRRAAARAAAAGDHAVLPAGPQRVGGRGDARSAREYREEPPPPRPARARRDDEMTCLEAEELLLESMDDALAAAGCVARSTATWRPAPGAPRSPPSLRAVDAAADRRPAARPSPPPSIAVNVRTRIRRERRAAFSESLPDLIHLAGCSVATALSAALLPIDAAATIAAGVGVHLRELRVPGGGALVARGGRAAGLVDISTPPCNLAAPPRVITAVTQRGPQCIPSGRTSVSAFACSRGIAASRSPRSWCSPSASA